MFDSMFRLLALVLTVIVFIAFVLLYIAVSFWIGVEITKDCTFTASELSLLAVIIVNIFVFGHNLKKYAAHLLLAEMS